MLRRSLAHRERQALCDLALELGPGAPTLRGGTVDQLVSALLQAERRRTEGLDFVARVAQLRRSPLWWRPLDLVSIVVAHEDVRRARDPHISIKRTLTERDDNTLWRQLKRVAPRLMRRHGVPVVFRRSDPPKTRWVAIKGDDPVTGKPLELLLAAHGGRPLYNVLFEGSRKSVLLR